MDEIVGLAVDVEAGIGARQGDRGALGDEIFAIVIQSQTGIGAGGRDIGENPDVIVGGQSQPGVGIPGHVVGNQNVAGLCSGASCRACGDLHICAGKGRLQSGDGDDAVVARRRCTA